MVVSLERVPVLLRVLSHSASPLFGFKKSAIILYTSVFRCLFFMCSSKCDCLWEWNRGASHWSRGSFLRHALLYQNSVPTSKRRVGFDSTTCGLMVNAK